VTSEEQTGGLGSTLREAVPPRCVAVPFAGVLAGYSVGVIGEEAVALPVVGSASGTLVGAAGRLVAGGAYYATPRCSDCGQRGFGLRLDCGCDGDRGDSCSVDP